MFSKGKVKNKLLGGSHVKSQKGGEKLIDGLEGNFCKGLMACESRWRSLIFWCLTSIRKDYTTRWRDFRRFNSHKRA